MATNVILPALGMAQDSGKIVEWLKAEGQHVTAGEALVVIETDKAAVDLEAPATGILARVSAKAGDEVPVAQVIAVILSPEEAAASGGNADQASASAAAPVPGASAASPVPAAVAIGASASTAAAPSPAPVHGANGRRLASPKARRIAAERGVDLTAIRGSGPGGVVLAEDVLAAEPAVSAVATLPAEPPAVSEPATAAAAATGTIWRLMAERTTQSWTTIPHFFLVREVNAEALAAWRARGAGDAGEDHLHRSAGQGRGGGAAAACAAQRLVAAGRRRAQRRDQRRAGGGRRRGPGGPCHPPGG